MRACLLSLVTAFVCAASGCANLNLANRGGCNCSESVGCGKSVGCSQPIGCSAAVSPYAPSGVSSAGPAGVSPYDPAAVAPYAGAPYAGDPNAGAPYGYGSGPYGPGYGRFRGHFHGRGPVDVGMPGAVVAYPYYTIRGPRDFLLDNPPSIGR
jgi:hypothetical protein